MAEAATDPLPVRVLQAGMQAAEDVLRGGSHDEALRQYALLLQRVLARRIDTGQAFRAADLAVLERVAELAVLFARLEAADDLLHAMARVCEQAGNPLAADHAFLKRAEMFASAGRLDDARLRMADLAPSIGRLEAIQLDAAGLAEWESHVDWQRHAHVERVALLTRCLLVMGRLLVGLGRYGEALAAIEHGLAHASADAPDLALRARAPLMFLRARALAERGDLEPASLALADLARVPEGELSLSTQAQRLELQGRLAMWSGRLHDAAKILRMAVVHCGAAGLAPARAAASLNLAQVLVLLNRIGEALALVDDAAEVARIVRDEALRLRCAALRQLAVARRSSQAYASAVGLSASAMAEGLDVPTEDDPAAVRRPDEIATTLRTEDFLPRFEERTLQFQWTLARDPDAAQHRLAELREAFGQSDSRLVEPRCTLLEGLLHARRGKHAAAARAFAKAGDDFAAIGLPADRWQAMHLQARSLLRDGHAEAAHVIASDAETLLDSLIESMPATDRAIYLLNKATVQEEALLLHVDELQRDAARVHKVRGLGQLAARWRHSGRIHALLDLLDRHRDAVAARELGAPEQHGRRRAPSLAARLLLAPRDQALVTFIVLPDRLVAIWSTFLRIGYVVTPVTRLELREHVRRWHEHAHGALEAHCTSDEAVAAHGATSQELLARIARRLQLDTVLDALPERATRLVVLGDDVLHGVPFAALPHRGAPLIRRFTLSTAFDSCLRPPPRPAAARRGLVVGVSTAAGERPLSAVRGECEDVATWMRGRGIAPGVLLEAQATRATVAARLPEVGFAHVACHGRFVPDRPEHSGLMLARDGDGDGLLSLRELAAMNLQHCDHLTLSACWSADSFVLPGHRIISLPEVLWRGGAHSILGSLWPVVDEISAPFMRRFHAALDRVARDAALREAQLACLDDPDTAAPYFWAGFVLHGDPRPLPATR